MHCFGNDVYWICVYAGCAVAAAHHITYDAASELLVSSCCPNIAIGNVVMTCASAGILEVRTTCEISCVWIHRLTQMGVLCELLTPSTSQLLKKCRDRWSTSSQGDCARCIGTQMRMNGSSSSMGQ